MKPVVLLLSLGFLTQSAGLSDADIDHAIALGRAHNLDGVVETCSAKRDTGGFMASGLIGAAISAASVSFDVTLAGPRGRIARAAQEAADKPTAATFDSERAATTITVTATPELPSEKGTGSLDLPPQIKTVSIVASELVSTWDTNERQKPARTIAPLHSEATALTRKNAAGATIDYQMVSATFDGPALQAIRESDIRLTLDTSAGTRSCKLSVRTIRRLLSASGK